MIASDPEDIPAVTRRAIRDRMYGSSFLDRCVDDIRRLLLPEVTDVDTRSDDFWDGDELRLWDESGQEVASGVNYDEIDF